MKRTIIVLAKKSVKQTKKITWEIPKKHRKLKKSWTESKPQEANKIKVIERHSLERFIVSYKYSTLYCGSV